jgi:hypothetical protein
MQNPAMDAVDYEAPMAFAEDAPEATPKHGTSVQASGWEAAKAVLKPSKGSGDYPTDFKFSESAQLVRFLEDGPFYVYAQHWLDRTEGKRSFVCLGDDCPLCHMLADIARNKFAFNILVVTEEEPSVKILTAPPLLFRQLMAANEDARRGPLTKYYWAISRQGSGPTTTYTLERVVPRDLAEEWELDAEKLDALAASATKYDQSAVYVTPRAELTTIARAILASKPAQD